MSKKVESAIDLFSNGSNCSQAVFATFCENYGINKEQAFKIACGFGGGIRSGEVCGAVSGAVMVIGLKYGNENFDDLEVKKLCCAKTVEFINCFKVKYNSIVCRELLGIDIFVGDGMKLANEKGLFKTTCVDMIRSAVEILEEQGY
ncbi:MAG: hypothetical protein A2Y15_05400 [Clostridiales bacterium GWF2_36_10]|nr:MAG: hypothetical protein A2Y15_05400 [Clostridiales bacterium GWF2_36_10]HAN20100.1 hypothetical protein [Clostridiales bacterium]